MHHCRRFEDKKIDGPDSATPPTFFQPVAAACLRTMPLILEAHDSLPYIDPDVSETERAKAQALISRELPRNHQATPHPSLAPIPAASFSELFSSEVNRVGAGHPREGGVDLSRYEAPDEPTSDSDVNAWRAALRNVYVSSTYLAGRNTNLSLLDEFGKNAWLIGNSQLEEILQDLEQELGRAKAETEAINKARKTVQEGSKGEMLALEDTWKTGIGKILEIQVATDGLRREILERRRNRGA